MTSSSSDLAESRMRAAKLSGGVSSDPIYSMIERVISEKNLRGSILDFGAGTGGLSRRLLDLKNFQQVAAVDILAMPTDLAGRVDWTSQDLNQPLVGLDGKYDVVVAAEVIEHLENPRFMMRELFRLLRPGGIALVTTPNNESWRSVVALLVRGHFAGFGDRSYPAHITALLRKDFSRIFTEAGFCHVEFRFTNQGGFPGRPTLTWQKIGCGIPRGVRFSDNILALGRKPGRTD